MSNICQYTYFVNVNLGPCVEFTSWFKSEERSVVWIHIHVIRQYILYNIHINKASFSHCALCEVLIVYLL
jgi:hypothetical protein